MLPEFFAPWGEFLPLFQDNTLMRSTPVCKRLSLTQADLGGLVPGGVDVCDICVESDEIIFSLPVPCVVQPV